MENNIKEKKNNQNINGKQYKGEERTNKIQMGNNIKEKKNKQNINGKQYKEEEKQTKHK